MLGNEWFFSSRFIKIFYDKESFSLTHICSIPPMYTENIFHGSAVYRAKMRAEGKKSQ